MVVAALSTSCTLAAAEPRQVVIVLADDLGWGDLSCHGHPAYRTPNIDRLAQQGIDVQQYTVAAPTCSPSRAGIMTGRFPARFGILYPFQLDRNVALNQPDWLDPRPLTLARLLHDAGYATAIRGKWHLVEEREGVMTDAPTPAAYGFSSWGLMRGPWPHAIEPRMSYAAATEYLRQAPREQPFFLYVTAHEPHVPYIPSSAALAANAHVDERSRRYAASVTDLDNGVGQILDTLRDRGLDQQTLVVFTSDNGPAKRYDDPNAAYGQYFNAGSTGGFRGHKGDLYEGGLRTPFIARWPGHITAGTVDTTSPIQGVDLLPTIAAATEVPLPPTWDGDGVNRLAVLTGTPSPRPRPLFWRIADQEAVRDGNWKLVRSHGKAPITRELFDLAHDPYEAHPVSDQPAVVQRLENALTAWIASLPTQPDPTTISSARTTGATPAKRQPVAKD